MTPTIDDVLAARAAAMAEHDGDPLGPVHIMGACSLLQAELVTARDKALNSHAASQAPAPVPEPEPEEESPKKGGKTEAESAPTAEEVAAEVLADAGEA